MSFKKGVKRKKTPKFVTVQPDFIIMICLLRYGLQIYRTNHFNHVGVMNISIMQSLLYAVADNY